MELRNLADKPYITDQDSLDKSALKRRLQEAEEARPGTFRYYDMELNGEVRTSVAQKGGLYSTAQAEVFRRDGASEVVGVARYTVAGGDATLDNIRFTASNDGVEWALLKEVSERAQAQDADRLRVWVSDDDQDAGTRWLRRGFQPTERDPGARGAYWERPLQAID